MALVICDGVQYDDDALPKHVDPKRCVPAAEWFRKNKSIDAPDGKVVAAEIPAPPAGRPDTGGPAAKPRSQRRKN